MAEMNVAECKSRARLSRWFWGLALLVVVAAHVGLVLRQFPFSSVLKHAPLCSGDLTWHFASAVEGSRFNADGFKISGYSPSFMAGYPWGTWNSFSKRGYEFATTIMPWCVRHIAAVSSSEAVRQMHTAGALVLPLNTAGMSGVPGANFTNYEGKTIQPAGPFD